MTDCLFCKIVRHEIPASIIHEDENVIAFLDIKPTKPGHLLIVPKQHSQGLHDADPTVLSRLLPVIQQLAKQLVETAQADGFNLIQNNNSAAGQVVPHLHFHLIPRHKDDGLESKLFDVHTP